MLKIKDNVDLKELEKFGFWKDSDINVYRKDIMTGWINIFEDRIIDVRVGSSMAIFIDWIYDLIKADLVEKVGE